MQNQTKNLSAVSGWIYKDVNNLSSTDTHTVAQWQQHGVQIRWMQVQISSVFYVFFFIPNLKDVGSNPDTVKL